MNLKNKIFLFDVNHTLINTAMGHLHAMRSMEQKLIEAKVEKDKANKILVNTKNKEAIISEGIYLDSDIADLI